MDKLLNLRNQLEAAYLEYFNNYLTLEKFAEHYGLELHHAAAIVEAGRYINEGLHPDN